MSMSILYKNLAIWRDCRLIAEVENNLFTNYLIDTTIQDGGKKERNNVIFDFTWLKTHNSKINWQKEKIVIIRCSICYSDHQDI